MPAAGVLLPLKEARERFERQHVLEALKRTGWNQTRAAALLEVNRNTLIAKMQQFALRPPGDPRSATSKATQA